MNNRNRLIIVALAMSVFAMLGFTGCKNACQKAADQMVGCMESFCDDHGDDPLCEGDGMTEMIEETTARIAEGADAECTEERQAQAEALTADGCDAIYQTYGFIGSMGTPE